MFLLTSSTVVIIVSKWVALVWRRTDFSQSIWPAGDQLTTAFTILNCLEYEFLRGFLVQGRQKSFWKFFILSNILDLKWCLPNKRKIHSQLSAMFSCWDAKGGKLSSQALKMLYKPPGAVYIASYKELLDQSDCWKVFVQLWNYTKIIYDNICYRKHIQLEGGQHVHVKLYVYFKLDYKFRYEFRRVLFLLHCFASVMILLCI